MLLQMAKIYSFLLLSSIPLSVCIYVCLYIILMCNHLYFVLFLFLFFSFIFIHWRLITLQYCSGFCHTLTWISHGFTGIPQITSPGWMHETSARAWCTGKIQRDCFYFFIGVWLVCKPFPLQEEVSWKFPPDCMSLCWDRVYGKSVSQPLQPFCCGYFRVDLMHLNLSASL